jgi:hypothetical protein
MSDMARLLELARTYDQFVKSTTAACNENGVTAAITNTSAAATLSAQPASLRGGQIYTLTGTGIPAGTTFRYLNSAAITMSRAATATNAAQAVTIQPYLTP